MNKIEKYMQEVNNKDIIMYTSNEDTKNSVITRWLGKDGKIRFVFIIKHKDEIYLNKMIQLMNANGIQELNYE